MNRYMLLALLPLAACSGTARSEGTPPSGTGGNRTFAVNGFTGVDAAGPDDVDVRVGSGFSVRAEGDPDRRAGRTRRRTARPSPRLRDAS